MKCFCYEIAWNNLKHLYILKRKVFWHIHFWKEKHIADYFIEYHLNILYNIKKKEIIKCLSIFLCKSQRSAAKIHSKLLKLNSLGRQVDWGLWKQWWEGQERNEKRPSIFILYALYWVHCFTTRRRTIASSDGDWVGFIFYYPIVQNVHKTKNIHKINQAHSDKLLETKKLVRASKVFGEESNTLGH